MAACCVMVLKTTRRDGYKRSEMQSSKIRLNCTGRPMQRADFIKSLIHTSRLESIEALWLQSVLDWIDNLLSYFFSEDLVVADGIAYCKDSKRGEKENKNLGFKMKIIRVYAICRDYFGYFEIKDVGSMSADVVISENCYMF